MNRAERRKAQKKIKGNVTFTKGVELVDHKADEWCHLHKLALDNKEQLTSRDEGLIKEITYKSVKTAEKDGTITAKKYCPRCFNTVYVDTITPPLLR